jgi:protein-tyrosine-phosphatase
MMGYLCDTIFYEKDASLYFIMKVLFICKSNQFRSQMAAALYNKITGTTDADSAGTYVGSSQELEDSIIEKFFRTPDFFELMEENSMYIRNNRTKKLIPEMLEHADTIIAMTEEPFIPYFLSNNKKVIWWSVENPLFATREISEKTYVQIKILIEKLIINLSSDIG